MNSINSIEKNKCVYEKILYKFPRGKILYSTLKLSPINTNEYCFYLIFKNKNKQDKYIREVLN